MVLAVCIFGQQVMVETILIVVVLMDMYRVYTQYQLELIIKGEDQHYYDEKCSAKMTVAYVCNTCNYSLGVVRDANCLFTTIC